MIDTIDINVIKNNYYFHYAITSVVLFSGFKPVGLHKLTRTRVILLYLQLLRLHRVAIIFSIKSVTNKKNWKLNYNLILLYHIPCWQCIKQKINTLG